MGLSNFASKSVEEVTATGATTFFQMYWTGDRDVMIQRMQRAADAGSQGLIATMDWSFSMRRDWGSPEIPAKVDIKHMIRILPPVANRRHLTSYFVTTVHNPHPHPPIPEAPEDE